MCAMQSAMAAEYGNFNTQAVPASVDIMGFSCRHVNDLLTTPCLSCIFHLHCTCGGHFTLAHPLRILDMHSCLQLPRRQ